MRNLQCRSDLGIRGREQAGNLLGDRLIRRQARQLGLPQIEITPGQPVEFGSRVGCTGRLVVVSGDHLRTITHSRANAASIGEGWVVALRHRR
ncbi:hypothetical protein [Reyranella sp.]|uniref:hypothetical protein n=1 Tax=Reyranella sp. TaxID=1929291 RepID=UPI003BAD6551